MTDDEVKREVHISGPIYGLVIGDHATTNIVYEGRGKNLLPPLQRPRRVEHFVGRETESTELLADLKLGRVITICGPGGMGKTALIAEVLWTLAPGDSPPADFPDGLFFYSFYNQPDVEIALEQLARTFGEEPTPTPSHAARRALSSRHALLVFDGAEEADYLERVLEVCVDCAVIVSSRRHSDAANPQYVLDLQQLPTEDGVTLLQAWGGKRAADKSTAAKIYELVGGLPLALSLIGKYLVHHDEEASEYLFWLEEAMLSALAQGISQQQNVPLLLERSVAKLGVDARRVLTFLGLMPLTLIRREMIAKSLILSQGVLGQALGELVNYGLVLRSGQLYQASHALIHTYAHEVLLKNWTLTECNEVRLSIALWYAIYINELQDTMLGLSEQRCIEQALVWADELGHNDLAVALYVGLLHFSHNLRMIRIALTATKAHAINYFPQAIQAAEDVATQTKSQIDSLRVANLILRFGEMFYGVSGFDQQGIELLVALLEKQRKKRKRNILDRQEEVLILVQLGNISRHSVYSWGIEDAKRYFAQALESGRKIQDRTSESEVLFNLGQIEETIRQPDKAEEFYLQALGIAREIHNQQFEATILSRLGDIVLKRAQMEEAELYFQQALNIAQQRQDRLGEGAILYRLGGIAEQRNEADKAAEFYQRALFIREKLRAQSSEGIKLMRVGELARLKGELDEANRCYQEGLVFRREFQDQPPEEGVITFDLALAKKQLGQLDEAESLLLKSIKSAKTEASRRDMLPWEAMVFVQLGQVAEQQERIEIAEQRYLRALEIARKLAGGFPGRQIAGEALHHLGKLANSVGQLDKAESYYLQALQIARELQSKADESSFLFSLGEITRQQEKLDEAKSFFLQAQQNIQAIQDKYKESFILFNIGDICQEQNQLEEAELYYSQALQISREVGHRQGEGTILSMLGGVAGKLEQWDKAEDYFQQSLTILREIQDRVNECSVLYIYGTFTESRGQAEKAESLYRRALLIAHELEDQSMENIIAQHLAKQQETE